MGAALTRLQVAGPIETFSRGQSPDTLTAAADTELSHLEMALEAAYGASSADGRAAEHTTSALTWLRQWRDQCLNGPDRHTLLPCLMERCFARAAASAATNGYATMEIKFLCTLCPAWARQILPQAKSETWTVGAWAAAGAALTTPSSRACCRQFATVVAVAVILASAETPDASSPLDSLHYAMTTALDGVTSVPGVQCLLEGLDALVTESTNRRLVIPPEARYGVRKSMLTRVVTVLNVVDGFFAHIPTDQLHGTLLQSAAELLTRCLGLATENVAFNTGDEFVLQPETLAALPHSALFNACLQQVGTASEGQETRAACEFLGAVAELSAKPDAETYLVLTQTLGAVGAFLQHLLRDPLSFDDMDTSAVVDVVATYADLLLVSGVNRLTTSPGDDPSHALVRELVDVLHLVSRIPSADPEKSSPAHGCIAIAARSLHPVPIPVLETTDASDAVAELEAVDRARAHASHTLMDDLLAPMLDTLLAFERTNDPEWDASVDLRLATRSLSIARRCCSGLDANVIAGIDANDNDDGEDDDDDDTRIVSVRGGDPCVNFGAAVSAVSRLVRTARVAADSWLPLALAHEQYHDPTTVMYIQDRAPGATLKPTDDALLVAAARAALQPGVVPTDVLRRLAVEALDAATSIKSVSFLTAAYALTTVVMNTLVAEHGTSGYPLDVQDLASRLFASRLVLARRAALPRFRDSTDSAAVNAHLTYRLAAGRAITETLAAGSMAAFSPIMLPERIEGPGVVQPAALGWMSIALDDARVVLAVAHMLGPAARDNASVVHAMSEAVLTPCLITNGFGRWWSHAVQNISNEVHIAAARELSDDFAVTFARLCEAFAPAPASLFANTTPDHIAHALTALCEAGASACAARIVGPLVELEPSALHSLPTVVFGHIAWLLPQLADANDALTIATAMCKAFAAVAERPTAAGAITADCAGHVHNAAAVVLNALATGRPPAELAFDWPEFRVWLDRLLGTVSATACLPAFGAEYAVPTSAVAAALALFAATWRARAASNTTTSSGEGREADEAIIDAWSTAEKARDSLLNACTWWCARNPDTSGSLQAFGAALARQGEDVSGIIAAADSPDTAAAALRVIVETA